MEIKKGNIKLKEQVACASSGALVEGDIVISDTMPDMAEILVADAKAQVDETVHKENEFCVNGRVLFKALYKPDNNDAELKCLEHTFPFSQRIDIKAADDVQITAEAMTEHIGFTLINSRKLSAKIMVLIKAVCYEDKNYEPIVKIDGAEAESREKKYSIHIPLSNTQSDIEISDFLTVPEDKPDIDEILKTDAWITSGDNKIMNGKAMVHGDLHITTIYTSADEEKEIVSVKHTVPFTEIIEAPGADEQSVVNVSFDIKDIFAASKGDLNGDTKIINIEAKVLANAKVSKSVSEKIVDDAYFLSGRTELTKDTMKIYEYITSENARISEKQAVTLPKNIKVSEIISCSAKPILREALWENGAAKVSGSLVTFLIYRDSEGNVRCAVTENDIEWQKPVSDECVIDAKLWLEDVNAQQEGENISVLANMGLNMKAIKPKRVNILTDCAVCEDTQNKKYPSMVIYFAKDGDTVWSVAKKYRTKAEKIKIANKIEGEKIPCGRRILIPKA